HLIHVEKLRETGFRRGHRLPNVQDGIACARLLHPKRIATSAANLNENPRKNNHSPKCAHEFPSDWRIRAIVCHIFSKEEKLYPWLVIGGEQSGTTSQAGTI